MLPGRCAASAAPDCSSGYFCAWYGSSYTGCKVSWFASDSDWRNNNCGTSGTIHDESSSWQNNGTYSGGLNRVQVFDGVGYTVEYLFCLQMGDRISYIRSINDRPSSHKWATTC